MIKFSAYKMLQTAGGKLPLDISFEMKEGDFLCLYGDSGAGKTTVLRLLAGLTAAENKIIEVDGEVWDHTAKKIQLPIQQRAIGFVFQDFALFPNLTVRENLVYAKPKGDTSGRVDELLELMEIQSLQNSRPEHLSGGQKQKVALARAIVRKPKILLLDEPLSALDDTMRFKLQDYILKIHQTYKLTTVLVSHHLPEIFKLANRVIQLDKGKLIKEGTPGSVFSTERISSKFKLTGEIVAIQQCDIVFSISVLVAHTIVKIIATAEETVHFKIGQKVIVASKAFNPVILPLH